MKIFYILSIVLLFSCQEKSSKSKTKLIPSPPSEQTEPSEQSEPSENASENSESKEEDNSVSENTPEAIETSCAGQSGLLWENGQVDLVDNNTQEVLKTIDLIERNSTNIVVDSFLTKDGTKLIVVLRNAVKVYDLKTQEVLREVPLKRASIPEAERAAYVTDNSKFLVVGFGEKTQIFDLENNTLHEEFTHEKQVVRVVIGPKSKKVVTITFNKAILIDIENKKVIGHLVSKNDRIIKVQFDQTGEKLAVLTDKLQIIDSKTMELVHSPAKPITGYDYLTLDLKKSVNYELSTGFGSRFEKSKIDIMIKDVESGETVHQRGYESYNASTINVDHMIASSDGTKLAIATSYRVNDPSSPTSSRIWVYDFNLDKEVIFDGTLLKKGLGFNSKGDILVATDSSSVKFYDLAKEELIAEKSFIYPRDDYSSQGYINPEAGVAYAVVNSRRQSRGADRVYTYDINSTRHMSHANFNFDPGGLNRSTLKRSKLKKVILCNR